MIRIRFHGRGGHGVKTASRILGTAAFTAGYKTQDSPIYGAERRGAAVVAFARVDTAPILERGVIATPDLIVIGDESLLRDPTAGVLVGQQTARAVFVNTEDAATLVGKFEIQPEVFAVDITRRTLDKLGRASALSVGLAAAAARLSGVASEQQLLAAAREELGHTGLSGERLDRNLSLASDVFHELPLIAGIGDSRLHSPEGDEVVTVPHQGAVLSTPSILATGNSEQRQTGAWRVERPVIDYDVCTRCGICLVRCPDGAIGVDAEGRPVIDYDHCKGCMECWEQCPVAGAMGKESEVRAW